FPTVTSFESDASKKAAGFDFRAPSSPAAAILLRAGPSAPGGAFGGTISSSNEGTPALAKCAAIRAPIVPAPRTATLWIRFMNPNSCKELMSEALTAFSEKARTTNGQRNQRLLLRKAAHDVTSYSTGKQPSLDCHPDPERSRG